MGTTAPICLHTLKIGNRASGVDTHRKEHDRPLPRLVRRGAYRFALLYRIAATIAPRALTARTVQERRTLFRSCHVSTGRRRRDTRGIECVGETWRRFVQCGLFERRSHPYGQGRSMDQDSRLPTLRDRDNGLLVYLGMF